MTREEALNECVSRDKAIVQLNHLKSDWDDDWNVAICKCIDTIKKLPPVTPQLKMGRWVKTIGENGVTSAIRCSGCGFEDNRYELFDYCPVCGVKMQEVEE